MLFVVVDPTLENQYQSTMDTHRRGGPSFLQTDAGTTAEASGEELV